MNRTKRRVLWWSLAGGLLVLIFLTGPKGPREMDALAGFLPGNPQRGGKLFFESGCASCHSIAGIGGKQAVDLARARQPPSDLEDIAGAMWNHAPEMFERMKSAGFEPPSLSPENFADLMAFLFVAGYLEEEGDPVRGRALLTSKKCRSCHALGGESRRSGPDLARWSSRANPILWAASLWNHAPEMEEAMKAEGIPWPQLTETEVVDVLAHLRNVGNAPRERAPLPGDPRDGRRLFQQHCHRCHRAEGQGGDVGPDLDSGTESRTLAGLAASLWNHSPAMGERMEELGVDRPLLSEQDIADIITYLFAIRYFERPGDRDAGAGIYSRSCGACHGKQAEGDTGPDIRSLGARTSAVFMASTLWNHGPRMYEEAQARGSEWPLFENHEMHDLIAYLRSVEE